MEDNVLECEYLGLWECLSSSVGALEVYWLMIYSGASGYRTCLNQ